MNKIQCCVQSCDRPLDQEYWDIQYKAKTTGWDLGEISPPIKNYINTIQNKDARILIPGCGNSYEAEYLLEKGFTNITVVDIAPTLVAAISQKFKHHNNIKIIHGDFFQIEGNYDLILEQTFFCALPPPMRQKYVWKMHQLLSDEGMLAGLLFDRTFEVSPPFGGSKTEYENLFKGAFDFLKIEQTNDSVIPRACSELFFEFRKNNDVIVNLYKFSGISCTGCMETVSAKFSLINGVINASMSTDFSEVLIVSNKEIPLSELQLAVSYEEKYKIEEITK